MRASKAIVGLVSAVAVLDGVPGAFARQDGGFFSRLFGVKGAHDKPDVSKAEDGPPYNLYGGPNLEVKAYSYPPPYGYPPPPPPPTTTSSVETTESSSTGK